MIFFTSYGVGYQNWIKECRELIFEVFLDNSKNRDFRFEGVKKGHIFRPMVSVLIGIIMVHEKRR